MMKKSLILLLGLSFFLSACANKVEKEKECELIYSGMVAKRTDWKQVYSQENLSKGVDIALGIHLRNQYDDLNKQAREKHCTEAIKYHEFEHQ